MTKRRDDVVRLGDAVDRLTKELGIPAAGQQRSVDDVWPEVVGPALAAHARVRSIRNGECVVEVDGPAYATQLRYLGESLSAGVNERCGQVLVTSVRIVVSRPRDGT
jgi:predicted nucleic acid-binding Zn ribbon protein